MSFAVILLFLTFLVPNQASAESKIYTGEKAEKILELLDWAAWNPQGSSGRGKYIYIHGGAMDNRTLMVIKKSKKIAKEVQIRWLFTDQTAEHGYLLTEKMPNATDKLIDDHKTPDTDLHKGIYSYNNAVMGNAHTVMGISSVTFPTLYMPTKKGLVVLETANINQITKELENVVASPSTANLQQTIALVQEVVDSKSGYERTFNNETGQPITAHILPSVNSPVVNKLETGYNVQVYDLMPQLGGDVLWVQVQVYPDPKMWKIFYEQIDTPEAGKP